MCTAYWRREREMNKVPCIYEVGNRQCKRNGGRGNNDNYCWQHALIFPFKLYDGKGAKGIDYGELGYLLQEGIIQLAPGTPQFLGEGWDSLLVAYANYKTDQGEDSKEFYKEWGIPEWRWHDLNDTRSRLRLSNFYAGIY